MGHGPQNPTPNWWGRIFQALCVNYYFFTWYSWGTDPQNPTPTFHFVKIIIFSLDTHGAGSTIVQALCVNYYFFTWYSWGTVHKIPPQLFTLWKLYFLTWYSWGRIHDCPSTLFKFFFFTWYSFFIHDCPSTLCKLLFFSLDTHGARSTKSHPNFSLCENYIFSLDTHGAGSTIVQALCVNYYFFTWYSWGTVHDCQPNFSLCENYILFFDTYIHDFPSTKKFFYFDYLLSKHIFYWYWWGTDHTIPHPKKKLILMGQDPRLSKHFV